MIGISGGLDSTTCLAIAKSEGFAPHALTVLYGQRHDREVEAARRVNIADIAAESSNTLPTCGSRRSRYTKTAIRNAYTADIAAASVGVKMPE